MWRRDPVFFVEHCLGHWTWSGQRRMLRSLAKHERTAVRANHSSSKTYTAAEALAWWFTTRSGSRVITAAPTGRQVRNLLWAEVSRAWAGARYPLGGDCQTQAVRTDDEGHYAIGFSTDRQSSAEGFHASRIMFILDEAKGILPWLWDSIEGSLTGGEYKWLAISTTDGVEPSSPFDKCFNDPKASKMWGRVHLRASDSPYVTGELFRGIRVPDKSRPDQFQVVYAKPEDVGAQMPTTRWIDERAEQWGKDSPLFLTKVKGEIVHDAKNSVVKLFQIEQMFANHEAGNALGQPKADGPLELGVDVARGGSDDSVIYARRGMAVVGREVITSRDMPAREKSFMVSDRVKILSGQNKHARIKVDDDGVGGGVTDILQRDGYNAIPVHFGGKSAQEERYASVASEMWYSLADKIGEISCPRSDRLQVELANRRGAGASGLDKRGRQMVESKDDYKKRGFRSPDEADAFLLAFYEPPTDVLDAEELKQMVNRMEDSDTGAAAQDTAAFPTAGLQ